MAISDACELLFIEFSCVMLFVLEQVVEYHLTLAKMDQLVLALMFSNHFCFDCYWFLDRLLY